MAEPNTQGSGPTVPPVSLTQGLSTSINWIQDLGAKDSPRLRKYGKSILAKREEEHVILTGLNFKTKQKITLH